VASAFGAATNPRRHRTRRQPALQLPLPGADRIQRETVAAGRPADEILLAAMPGGPDPRIRIVGEVWPPELTARESDPGEPANLGSRRRPTMKLGAEPREAPRFGAIGAVCRNRSTWWSIQAHCQRSYVRVEIVKNESLHAQREGAGRQNDFFEPQTRSIGPFRNNGSICDPHFSSRQPDPTLQLLVSFW
jgi:hypothetical protein